MGEIAPQKRLIEEIRSIVLEVPMMDLASREGVELIAAIVFDQKRKEREACARLAVELTEAHGQKNAKSEWRAQIGQEIAAGIRRRNDERG